MLKPVFLAILVVACLAEPVWAATYYVDQSHPNASDSNAGTSETTPWRTLVRAMTAAAGDTVYVKSGTYTESNTIMFGTMPALQPATGGQPGNPIAFRVFPGNAVTLAVSLNHSAGNNYIIWDGFAMAPGTFVRIYGESIRRVLGTVLQNLTIQPGPIPPQGGNYVGIFLQYTSQTVIRNCIIRDVYFSGKDLVNASGITLYFNDRAVIENNEIYRTNVAIFDKAGGEFNTFRNNYIHDVYNTGILAACFGHDRVACRGSDIYQNIISNVRTTGIAIGSSVVLHIRFQDFRVYNNTIHNVPHAIANGSTPGIRLWNNIVSATSSAMVLRNPRTDVALSDYSAFYPVTRFAADGTTYLTLSSWQRATGLDFNSIRQDPLFVDPGAGDFRLRIDSSARGAGRVGGIPTGAAVDMGAYPTGTERIGPCREDCRRD